MADCDRIYHEKASAASAKNRPELQKALDFVRDEDVFVVTKLDRLARSVVDLAGIVQKLEAEKVDLVVLDQGMDPAGAIRVDNEGESRRRGGAW
ncbi:MAG: recombinase family protein [Desulfuromonadales bacterium]